ncbi:MAG: GNAT family N-acetyltransferase [Calothrix sp. MO_167.B12]|nr:GNAT family N-acetyltransferase [Calothrix sp. MO_167.B12]
MGHIIIQIADFSEDFPTLQEIRKIVFHEEQGINPELEFDGLDEISQHLIAFLNSQAVGTARIRYLDETTAKIERLAVLPMARRKGIGKQITMVALDVIASQNVSQVVVHAQEYIKDLYENLGFQPEGEIFEEASIRHVKMRKILH